MLSHSFEARIVNGQLVPAEVLKAFEGQQVHITVSVPAKIAEHASSVSANDGREPPEDLDVEKDVYVRMPLQNKAIPNPAIVKKNDLKPCLILPEGLPDE